MKKLFLFIALEIFLCFPIFLIANPIPVITTRLVESFPIEMRELIEYPVYINAFMDDEEGVEIDRVEVMVDGEAVTVKQGNGFYYFLFRPEAFQEYTIQMTAYATNTESASISRTVSVTNIINTHTVRALEDVVIEFGGENSRWYTGTYELPQHAGTYEKVNGFLTIECPAVTGGCDDWDRVAWIEVKGFDGDWIELLRYITPYGTGCDHVYDMTALNSLLQGEVEFRIFVDTWGTGGWQFTLDLEHRKGFPLYPYSRVDEIWDGTYDFGNPANLQPVPVVNYQLPANARQAQFRLTNTGHGWGENNTANAAEFFHAFHQIKVDGNLEFVQDLWWDCNPNPDGCTGQAGSWTFDRAGWCPGAIATPDVNDFSSYVGMTAFDLSYIFQESYMDNCHANNPSCVSGVTCPDCNDGFNPVYYVDGVMVSLSDVPLVSDDYQAPPPLPTGIIDNYSNIYEIKAYPNPSTGQFKLAVSDNLKDSAKILIYDISGATHKVYYFNSAAELTAHDFDITMLSSGNYFIKIETQLGEGVLELVLD